jgi:hypothetical protein
MRKPLRLSIVVAAFAVAAVVFPSAASAQGGHFVTGGGNAPMCTDNGTTLTCTGKVAGLGGTTFEITVSAPGEASVTCANPGKNEDVPGQRTSIDASGTSDELPTPRNGQYVFSVSTNAPTVPDTPTCPSAKWDATVVDVTFGGATLTLLEDGVPSDTFGPVPVS